MYPPLPYGHPAPFYPVDPRPVSGPAPYPPCQGYPPYDYMQMPPPPPPHHGRQPFRERPCHCQDCDGDSCPRWRPGPDERRAGSVPRRMYRSEESRERALEAAARRARLERAMREQREQQRREERTEREEQRREAYSRISRYVDSALDRSYYIRNFAERLAILEAQVRQDAVRKAAREAEVREDDTRSEGEVLCAESKSSPRAVVVAVGSAVSGSNGPEAEALAKREQSMARREETLERRAAELEQRDLQLQKLSASLKEQERALQEAQAQLEAMGAGSLSSEAEKKLEQANHALMAQTQVVKEWQTIWGVVNEIFSKFYNICQLTLPNVPQHEFNQQDPMTLINGMQHLIKGFTSMVLGSVAGEAEGGEDVEGGPAPEPEDKPAQAGSDPDAVD